MVLYHLFNFQIHVHALNPNLDSILQTFSWGKIFLAPLSIQHQLKISACLSRSGFQAWQPIQCAVVQFSLKSIWRCAEKMYLFIMAYLS
jgi:hypothetical protein